MAVYVTASVTARCWKQHVCCACGCVYRYILERTGSASGGPGTGQATRAAYDANRAILSGIEEHPCPDCGVVQPDMVGKSKATWHLTFTAITGVILLFIFLPALGGSLPLDRAGEAAAAVAGFALLGHLVTALYNPNWSLKGNQEESRGKMRQGEMVVDSPGQPMNPAAVPANLTAAHLVCLMAILAAPLGFLAARFVSQQYPMPRNPGCTPDVISPGESVRIPIETKVRTYGGYWCATASAKLLNADELGVTAPFHAGSETHRWNRMLVVKDSDNPLEGINPWVKLIIPDDPALSGKKLRLQVTLMLTYPIQARRGADPLEAATKVQREVSLELAEAGAERLYRLAWYVGGGGGMAGCVLGGLVLTLLGLVTRSHAITPRTYLL
ncbi:MAG: hypothetical protein ACRC33_13000 [Gemmataceae bacterium]